MCIESDDAGNSSRRTHPKRNDAGTAVDDISEQLYGKWGGIDTRDEEATKGPTVDDISEQLYGLWITIVKRHEEAAYGATVDNISDQPYIRLPL